MNLQCLKYGGEEAVSAYAVLAYIVSFMELLVQGISDGSQPLLSLSKGAQDKKALKNYTRWTFLLGIGLGVLSGSSVYLSRYLIPAFYGTSEKVSRINCAVRSLFRTGYDTVRTDETHHLLFLCYRKAVKVRLSCLW